LEEEKGGMRRKRRKIEVFSLGFELGSKLCTCKFST
jgi:hypothetical protein